MNRRPWLIAVIATFTIGLLTRLFPLWWSPYPATLDGIIYARDATDTLAHGALGLEGFTADAITSTLLYALTAAITGMEPIRLAQPLYALIGAPTVLLGFLFIRRLGGAWHWSPTRIRTAGVLAAFTIATEGIFVRRSGVPDDDAITLFLIPLVAWIAYQLTQSGRIRWYLPLVALLAIFPITHTFSTLVLALTVTAILTIRLIEPDLRRPSVFEFSLLSGFWVYFAAYYQWAGQLGLEVPYVGRITSHPGLFVAWIIVLIFLSLWFRRGSSRAQRIAVLGPLGLFFIVVMVNTQITIFPGTGRTPGLVLLLIAPLVVPAGLAAWGSPLLGRRNSIATVLLALLLAPMIQVLFSLTASLTPEFWATAMRAQTHFHIPVLVLAAGIVSGISVNRLQGGLSRYAGPLLTSILLISVLATLPVAYVDLDTGAYPSTTTQSEWDSVQFGATYINESWATSHTLSRVATGYFGTSVTYGATATWLNGGPSPNCPVLSKESWTTTGAHLFPAAPATILPDTYENWLIDRNVIYSASGYDQLALSLPRSSMSDC